MFEPSRAPGTRTAPKRPAPAVPPKAPKVQKPAPGKEPEIYTDRVSMEVVDQQPLPEYQRRIPLHGIPVEEPVTEPEKKVTTKTEMKFPKFGVPVEDTAPTKQTLYLKEKPRFIQVTVSL